MIWSSIFLLSASQEFFEAWQWYEDKQIGLGDRFKKEVYSLIHKIEQLPERYIERKKYYREARINIFPYLIIYRIDKKNNLIVILSIFHTSRNPLLKYKR